MLKALFTFLSFLLCTLGYSLSANNPAFAQVTSDGTVNTEVNDDGKTAEITGGETRGDNLFHSFEDFSVKTGNEAFFNNADSISNIFSRVTGGNVSDINGAIRANGSASLFLINPAGIIFGENASLNIGGSFYGSSASGILFEDGEFSAADLDNPPLLTVNAPISLGFRDNPGDIVNRSDVQDSKKEIVGLEVSPGNNLTLVGGNINFEAGQATVSGGNIELGGLAEAGIVSINPDGNLSFPDDVTKADINLSNGADVDVIGAGGGSVTVNARNLKLTSGKWGNSEIKAGISPGSTSVDSQAGDIAIDVAEKITLNHSSISNQVEGVGNSGNITITTGSLEAINGGHVNASTEGQGNAGNVRITATGDISIDGEASDDFPDSGVYNNVYGVGNAGEVTIFTNNLTLTNGGQVNASTEINGNAGNVRITATGDITIDGETSLIGIPSGVISRVGTEATGNAGEITISTTNLNLSNGGTVDTSTFNYGNAGAIKIVATGDITIDGETSQGISSGVQSLGDTFDTGESDKIGNAGNVNISTTNLTLTNGGQVDASTFGDGNAGNVNITATGDITIDGETSQGGSSGIISLVNDGLINSLNPPAEGDAGGITINATNLNLTDGGKITASTEGIGDAGAVKITTTEDITLKNNSNIAAIALGDFNGGNLSIDARFIVAYPSNGTGNDLLASADAGRGGNINLDVQQIFGLKEGDAVDRNNSFSLNSSNDLDASSNVEGLSGNVTINTLDVNPVQGATELPSNVVEAKQATEQTCSADRNGKATNGLAIAGRGGVHPAPDNPLNSENLIKENSAEATIPEPIETSQGKIQPARGIMVTKSGRIVLTAYHTNNAGERILEYKVNCGQR
jgi:filamentous hemagglutinin family protein